MDRGLSNDAFQEAPEVSLKVLGSGLQDALSAYQRILRVESIARRAA
jgi:hypothetical protein